ncbi:class I SAM-dependent methyltransferase [Qipengyuania sp. MTN3-11]|uniref:class I SAM-dependent methyltransferase n=1 Tax=Qipengyuania sp. MTN3-11 TaxID=3056557 RepID=UPI0036F3C30A
MKSAHEYLVFRRRVRVLAESLARLIPANARVLDVGCGSGDIAAAIMQIRPDIAIEGVDVLVRDDTAIPVRAFDGYSIDAEDEAFDVAMMVDVLHHTDEPARILAEAARVAKYGVVVKDHFRDGFLAGPTLRFMDWVGNASHGVRLPYNYLAREEWQTIWSDLGLTPRHLDTEIGLYAKPFDALFGRELHFVTMLAKDAQLHSLAA